MTAPTSFTTISLDALNRLDRDGFVTVLAGIFEHSPWIPAAVYGSRPFASVESLHAGMVEIMLAASADDQRRLLEAHPELGGRAARERQLTAASTGEQAGAGLDRLEADEAARLAALNAAYRQRFGFPFIIAVRGQRDRGAIIQAIEARTRNTEAEETATALREVAKIAWFRLSDLVDS
jgi:2-oxo-4-hydroxy-4-carboxy-5-ureidoimidazoline decarboxylase